MANTKPRVDVPVEIGRRTLRVSTILVLIVIVLMVATALADLPADPWLPILAVAFAVLSVLLLIGPSVAFVVHSVRHRDEGVTPRLLNSALLSAVAPASIGVLMITGGQTLFVTVGWVLVGVAAVVIVRAWAARETEANVESHVLRNGYSFAGLVLVLLAATAMPPHSHSREKAYLGAMKSDLRNLASAQEAYFTDHTRYTTDLAELGFKASTGVTAPKVTVAQGWWHATNTHSQLSNVTCGLAVNTTNPLVAAALDGEPACK
jgi:Tfp pilus assembly protein PilE